VETVESELADLALPPRSDDQASGPKDLSELVERYLADHFAGFGKELPPPGLYRRIIRQVEMPLITAALASTRGNQIRAAELLGLNRNTLREKIQSLDIQVFRSPQSH
jgi:two-component system nitrogen regulation response regulator GlnG